MQRILIDFSVPANVARWSPIDDGVMGGLMIADRQAEPFALAVPSISVA